MTANPKQREPGPQYLDYRKHLKNQLRTKGKRRKGDETRDRLMLAAAETLNHGGYHSLRVADVCDRVGVASSTFYLYFKNRTDITIRVLKDFLLTLGQFYSGRDRNATAFEAMYSANLQWLKSIRLNSGLHRCMLQLSDEVDEFSEFMLAQNAAWYERVTRSVLRRYGETSDVEPGTIRLAVYALGSMMDEICRKLVVHPDPALNKLVDETTTTDEQLAEFLTVIWYKTLFGENLSVELQSPQSRSLITLHTNA